MRKHIKFLPLYIGMFLIAGCASQNAIATNNQTATPEPQIPVATTSVEKPVEVVDYCTDCHTNKEQLMTLAQPVLASESESKGVG